MHDDEAFYVDDEYLADPHAYQDIASLMETLDQAVDEQIDGEADDDLPQFRSRQSAHSGVSDLEEVQRLSQPSPRSFLSQLRSMDEQEAVEAVGELSRPTAAVASPEKKANSQEPVDCQADHELPEVPNKPETALEEPASHADQAEEIRSVDAGFSEVQLAKTQSDEIQSDEIQSDEIQGEEIQGEETQAEETQAEEPLSDELPYEETQAEATQANESQSDESQSDVTNESAAPPDLIPLSYATTACLAVTASPRMRPPFPTRSLQRTN